MSESQNDLHLHLQQALGSAYTLERELGGGGMARVFVADETSLGRRVVVKVLSLDLAHGLNADRFAREVRLAAGLQHPNILPVFAAGVAAGAPYYTMPYVEGESLRIRLQHDPVMPVAVSISILRDVARALDHAHAQGVVHRDIKPDNILLSQDVAVVADFGIAKAVHAARALPTGATLTQLGTAIGTPAYMAPEQAAGDPAVDHRADLYAWGVVAYELLAGRHPFMGRSTPQALIVAHLIEVPVALEVIRPGLPDALSSLVMRCLSKEPLDRPSAARDLVDVLAGTLGSSLDAQPAARRPSMPSIAVLPFVNLSADPDNEYFSDGMSEEVLNVLAQDAGLRVAARSSSFAFKGTQTDLRTIGEHLHVTNLLEGSVRRVGNRVRITAQLVDAANGFQLWSDRFDRELTDIFAVQDEIAAAIATTLAERLRGGATIPAANASDESRVTRRTRMPVSVDAYDAYLKGRYANQRRGMGHESAPEHFERALALEPNFAAAHAGLGESFLWLAIFSPIPPVEAFARVRRHAQRALAYDNELADAHWLLAEVSLWHDWDVEASEEHVARALALEPHHAGAHMTAALCHNTRVRKAEALASAAAAVQNDPLGLGSRTWFLAITYNVQEFDLTIAESTRLIAEQPAYGEGYRWRAMARIALGELTLAAADLRTAGELGARHLWWQVSNAQVAAYQGDTSTAQRVRDTLMERAGDEWVSPNAIGQIEQSLGNYDAALAQYERAYQSRDFFMTVFHTDAAFRMTPPGKSSSIVDDPRWTNIVRRVGCAPGVR